MKRTKIAGLSLLVCFVGFQSQASVVYEGFDYTVGSDVDGQGTGDGWNGNWAVSGGSNPADVVAGLTGSGGAARRPTKTGNAAISRSISTTSQTTLTGGSTMYFSVLMKCVSDTESFALNSYGTIVLGDTALTGGAGFNAAPIGGGGNAIGVGFAGTGGGVGGDLYTNVRAQGVTYTGGAYTENTAERITVGDATLMIVGQVQWDAGTAGADVVSLYNVTDPGAALPTAFSTMEVDLDQSAFNVVSIGDAQTSIFDEIRMDTTLAAVMIPEPATLGLVGAFGAGILFVRRRFMS